MPPRVSSQSDKQHWSTTPQDARRSRRVLLSMPIRVSGKTARGESFQENARTLVVNAHGALISLSVPVAVGQVVTVANESTQTTVECRFVHLGSGQGGRPQTGIEFVKPSPAFWQIDFPPDDWVAPES